MADINLNFGIDDSLKEIVKAVERMESLMKKINETGIFTADEEKNSKQTLLNTLKLNNEIQKIEKSKQRQSIQDQKAAAKLKEQSGIIGGLEKQVKEYTAAWKAANTEAEKKAAKKNLDDIKKKLTEAKDATASWTKALGSFQFKFNALGNIAANVLSGMTREIKNVIKEFISFEKIINSTQATGDNWAATMGSMKAGFDALNRAIATGDWVNFLEKFKDAAKAGREYILSLDDIADRQRAINIRWARAQVEIAKLEGIMRNVGNTEDERAEAARKIHKITMQFFKEKEAIAEQNMQAERTRLMDTYKLNEAQAGAVIQYIENYDRLTKSQYDNISAVTAAKKEYDILTAAVETQLMTQDKRLPLTQRKLEKQEQIYNNLINSLTEQELQYYKIDQIANNVLDKERDRIASVSIEWSNAQRQIVEYENKADKALGRIEKAGGKKLNEIFTEGEIDFEEWIVMPFQKASDKVIEINQQMQSDLLDSYKKNSEELEKIKQQEHEREQLRKRLEQDGDDRVKDEKIKTLFMVTDAIRENSKNQQVVAIGEAVINQALAVSEVWKKWAAFPQIAWPLTALAVAQTAAQIATIKAQKFAEGGEVGGKPHSQGGTKIEAERGEFVIKKSAYQRNKELVQAINSEDSMRIAEMMSKDRKIIIAKQKDYTKELYELLSSQEHGYETPEFYVIQKGNRVMKLRKPGIN